MSIPRSLKPAFSTCCIHSPRMGAWWMGRAQASDHKGPNKPDEKAVVPRASRRREDTSDGEGPVTAGPLKHHHQVIWADRGHIRLVLRRCGEQRKGPCHCSSHPPPFLCPDRADDEAPLHLPS